ncbi:hypothetical protein [Arthrobacter terrae]|uniref:hypothetical protein n=1 Tax=Arthrobacter terrae TaxID=2935737 RepID=UPI0028AF9F11|nr:hypothetical protein [Arthrobacter terrae]
MRERVLAAVERIVRGEAIAAGATTDPIITADAGFPAVVNDPAALERTVAAFNETFGAGRVVVPGPVTGSEDVGLLATAAGAPLAFWLLGGADPALFSTGDATDPALRAIPSNHSPLFAPVIEPTLSVGVAALAAAARAWLPPLRD